MAGDIVEQGADRPHDGSPELGSVSVDPQLLLRRAHPDQHDVGPVGVDLLDHPLVVRRVEIEVAVVGPYHVQSRMPTSEPLRRLTCDRRLRAQQVDRVPRQLAERGEPPDPVSSRHPVRNGKIQHPSR